jgi:hypothetical protein
VPEQKDLPDYHSPPVIEVVYGVAFDPLTALRAPHTGLFWSSIKGRFPKVEHAVPIGPVPRAFDLGNLPLPRIWFISPEGNYLNDSGSSPGSAGVAVEVLHFRESIADTPAGEPPKHTERRIRRWTSIRV